MLARTVVVLGLVIAPAVTFGVAHSSTHAVASSGASPLLHSMTDVRTELRQAVTAWEEKYPDADCTIDPPDGASCTGGSGGDVEIAVAVATETRSSAYP
ncbi:MAG TPA: hypothetical protein VGD37_09020 [Kofleriaceae bacterium]|jgi:hypothetical protein